MKFVPLTILLALILGIACSSGNSDATDNVAIESGGSSPAASQAAAAVPSDAGQKDASETAQTSPSSGSSQAKPAPDISTLNIAPSPQPDQSSASTQEETPEPGSSEQNMPTEKEPEGVILEAGQIYTGGTVVRVSELGIAFQIPKDWSGGMPQGVDALILSSETHAGMLTALGQQSSNVDEIVNAMSQPVPLDNTTVLMPVSQPEVSGQWVNVRYSGSDGINPLVGYATAMVSDEGRGILYIVAGLATDDAYFQELVARLVDSTVSVPVVAQSSTGESGSSDSDNTPLAQEWANHLSGQLLTYMSSYSSSGGGTVSSSAKREMYLCRDGRFFYQDESSVSVDVSGAGGFSGGQDSDPGQWRIITQGNQAGLEYEWDSGSTSQHLLEFREGATYIDDERWFVTPDNNYC